MSSVFRNGIVEPEIKQSSDMITFCFDLENSSELEASLPH